MLIIVDYVQKNQKPELLMMYFEILVNFLERNPGIAYLTAIVSLLCLFYFGNTLVRALVKRKNRASITRLKSRYEDNYCDVNAVSDFVEEYKLGKNNGINLVTSAKDNTKPAEVQKRISKVRENVAFVKGTKENPTIGSNKLHQDHQHIGISIDDLPSTKKHPQQKSSLEGLEQSAPVQGPPSKTSNTKPAKASAKNPSSTEAVPETIKLSKNENNKNLLKTAVAEGAENDVSYINYMPNSTFVQVEPWSYPYVKMPKAGCVLRVPREYRRQRRGHTEYKFQRKLETLFGSFTISGDHSIPISDATRPYEPDISLIIRDSNLNIFIDIEIDEPYASENRTPLHCIGSDDLRDAYFTDRGWMVIRFTERQIALQPQNCLAFIARVIASVYRGFALPTQLRGVPGPEKEDQWTKSKALQWAEANYREKYLKIDSFGQVEVEETAIAIVLSTQDLKAEALVNPSVVLEHDFDRPNSRSRNIKRGELDVSNAPDIHSRKTCKTEADRALPASKANLPKKTGANSKTEDDTDLKKGTKTDLKVHATPKTKRVAKPDVIFTHKPKPIYPRNIENRHERDSRIQCLEEGLIYHIDGKKAKSITEAIDGCFHLSNPEGVKDRQLDRELHDCIEKFYHGVPSNETAEFQYFKNFHEKHPSLKPYRTEWHIFDEYNLVAGTIDLITDNRDGSYDVYEWKRSKKVIDPDTMSPIRANSAGRKGVGEFSHIYDTTYNRYCLEQSMHKLILERYYGIRVRIIHLVIIHPSIGNYYKVPVQPMIREAQLLIQRHS